MDGEQLFGFIDNSKHLHLCHYVLILTQTFNLDNALAVIYGFDRWTGIMYMPNEPCMQ